MSEPAYINEVRSPNAGYLISPGYNVTDPDAKNRQRWINWLTNAYQIEHGSEGLGDLTRKLSDTRAYPDSVLYPMVWNVLASPTLSHEQRSAITGNEQHAEAWDSAATQQQQALAATRREQNLTNMTRPANPGVGGGGPVKFSPFDDVFKKYAGDLANNDEFISIVAAGTKAESQWNPSAVGKDPTPEMPNAVSAGLFQEHDVHGISLQDRIDPDKAAARMVPQYANAYKLLKATHPELTGSDLAAQVAGMAEKPAGYTQNGLARNSDAWTNYTRAYAEVHGLQGAHAPYDASGVTGGKPPLPKTGFPDRQAGYDYITQIGIWEQNALDQLGEPDPMMPPDPRRKEIAAQADNAVQFTMQWLQSERQNGLAEANLRISQASQALAGARFNWEVGHTAARDAVDDQRWESNFARQAARDAIDDARWNAQFEATTTGYITDPTTGEKMPTRETRNFESNQQLTRDQMAQTADFHRQQLQSEFAQQSQSGARDIATATQNSAALMAKLAPDIIPAGSEYVPGYEPGGSVERSVVGLRPFTPMLASQLQAIYPNAGVGQLQAQVAAALAQHPGNPANLATYSGGGP